MERKADKLRGLTRTITDTDMPSNTTQIATLEAQPVPADRECVRSGSEIARLVQDYVTVNGIASGNVGAGLTNVTNNVAAQALIVANEAKAGVAVLEGERKQRRAAASRIPLPVGDSTIPLTWSPVMPSTQYHVSISLWGDNSPIAATGQPGFRLVTGSETTGSVLCNFGNAKANMSFTYVVEEL